MGRYAFLVMVTEANNNKFYEMIEQDNGTIDLFNGRVDVTRIQQSPKPSSQWEKIYNSKIKKGYQDITDLVSKKVVKKNQVNYVDIDNKEVRDVINKLMQYSKQTVDDNYKVKSSDVTQKQIDEAQSILNETTNLIKKGNSTQDINNGLLRLFTVIPRKMGSVRDYLLEGDTIKSQDDLNTARQLISKEQDILDSMASGVSMCSTDDDEDNDIVVENKTILDKLGIEMKPASDEDITNIKNHLGMISDKFRRAFVVTHKDSREKFNKHVEKTNNKTKELLWHGSRNSNWISILRTSLLIRPSGVATVGSMFGLGIYFAKKAIKAYGYTSSSSAYWTRGNSKIVYMAVFAVHVGNQKQILRHDSSCYNLNEKDLIKEGYDSVFAKGGYDLKNDEFIIYNHNQCTMKYLVELEG